MTERHEIALRLMDLVGGRADVFSEQTANGKWEPVRRSLVLDDVVRHLGGEWTIGVYPVVGDKAKWLCLDIDVESDLAESGRRLERLWQSAAALGIPEGAMLREFSGRKGHHLWVFFDDWVPAADARRLGNLIASGAGVLCEVFPKQDDVDGDGFGNLVKLPLGVHRVTGKKSEWLAVHPVTSMPPDALAAVLQPHTGVAAANGHKPTAARGERIGPGFRHNALVSECGQLRRRGYDDDATYDALMAWANLNLDLTHMDESLDVHVRKIVEGTTNWREDPRPPVRIGGRGEQTPAGGDWRPVDIAKLMEGDMKPPLPTTLHRTDGVALLYDGMTHFLYGKPGSGKTWVALVAVAEVLGGGGQVVYLDFENGARRTVSRLLWLGVDRERIATALTYINPLTPSSDENFEPLERAARGAALLVVDGFNFALVLDGREPNSNKDVMAYWSRVVTPLVQVVSGPVLIIDHVTKDGATTGYGPVGAGQKAALISGANFECEMTEPLGHGKTGKVMLRERRDQPGALRQHEDDEGVVATFELLANTDGTEVKCRLRPPEAFRPTHLMERICAFLLLNPDSSQTQVEEGVAGRMEYKRLALRKLVQDGYASEAPRPGRGGGKVYSILRPFLATEIPTDDSARQGVFGDL
jgi:hypothetical protein